MRRRGIQIGHSLNMIAELPHYTHDPDVPAVLRAAALDAFFVHLRLLVEFLITKPRSDRPPVISRWDYAKGFGLDNALRERLQAASDFANVHVAHFNAGRVPTVNSPVSHAPSHTSLVDHRQDVFTAMTALVQYLSDAKSAYAADFDGWLSDAQRRAGAVPRRHTSLTPAWKASSTGAASWQRCWQRAQLSGAKVRASAWRSRRKRVLPDVGFTVRLCPCHGDGGVPGA